MEYAELTWTVPGILLGSAVLSTLYAVVLNRIDYSPGYTWLTVVGGNAMIGGVIAVFCALGILPWLAFQLLFAVNLAMGLPIIVWQVGLDSARQWMTKKGTAHASAHEGRPGDQRAPARRPGRD